MSGFTPYLGSDGVDMEREEDSLLNYLALSVGPSNKDMSTMITQIREVAHFRKLKLGANPISATPRAHLMIRGMRREKGPAAIKSPFTLSDLKSSNVFLDLDTIDRQIARGAVLLGRFFMLRMSEIAITSNLNLSEDRRPLHMRDVDPLSQGVRAHWGIHVDEVSIRISCCKTDWVNQGRVRSHTLIPLGSANSDLCVARSLVGLRDIRSRKFATGVDKTFE